ncbi:unnamed protein product, partial [Mesorhabditis belari]|uniref:Uncharacterized protein n=1 Tax=Mesorhabditis belari TaxID=2138241 RepID=A0AAF3EKA1_9BILA
MATTLICAFLFCAVPSVLAIGDLWPDCWPVPCCTSCNPANTSQAYYDYAADQEYYGYLAETPSTGVWSNWVDYTACTKTCGLFGRKVQRRNCTSWSFGCPCTGAYSRLVPCPTTPCPCPKNPCTNISCASPYKKYLSHWTAPASYQCGNVTRADDFNSTGYCEGLMFGNVECNPCPPGGVWSAWSNVGPCSATCGLHGKVNQTRSCDSAGYGCACTGPTTRQYLCPKNLCPKVPHCAPGNVVVKNLVTKANQCGLQLAPDQVLHPPCGSYTTTTPKATTTTTTPATG